MTRRSDKIARSGATYNTSKPRTQPCHRAHDLNTVTVPATHCRSKPRPGNASCGFPVSVSVPGMGTDTETGTDTERGTDTETGTTPNFPRRTNQQKHQGPDCFQSGLVGTSGSTSRTWRTRLVLVCVCVSMGGRRTTYGVTSSQSVDDPSEP